MSPNKDKLNTHYLRGMQEMCFMANMSMEEALKAALPNMNAIRLEEKIVNGEELDLTCTTALANFFGTGIDTFYENFTEVQEGVRTYLIGPITGNPNFMDQFTAAELYLTSRGCHVFNPARMTAAMPKAFMTRQDFMDLGLCTERMCEQVALLPGHETHTGCQMELAYAQANGYKIIELTEGHLNDGRRLLPQPQSTITA